jgi:hypothetical protein
MPWPRTAASAPETSAVWVNRDGRQRPADRPDLVEVADLAGLPATLAAVR